MKRSVLYSALAVIAGLIAAVQSSGTTFEQYDKMPFKQQSQFIEERAKLIYRWLEKNDPEKAKCMIEHLEAEIEINGKKFSKFLYELEIKIRGVPAEDRGTYKIETLMTNFIVKDLCGHVTSNPPQQGPVDSKPAK